MGVAGLPFLLVGGSCLGFAATATNYRPGTGQSPSMVKEPASTPERLSSSGSWSLSVASTGSPPDDGAVMQLKRSLTQ